jgi:hypothetical protein
MRTARLAVGVALLWLVALAARAAPPATPPWQGVFTNPAQSEDGINAAIEAAVSQVKLAARPFARARLKRVNLPLRRVEIALHGSEIAITLGAAPAIVVTPGHAPVKWARDDGEVFDVAVAWEDGALVQTATSGESRRTNRFTLSPDGATLDMAVTLTGPQLHVPPQYRLTFRRQMRPD